MSLPQPPISFFDKNAKVLKIDPFNGPEAERLKFYRKTLDDIVDFFYDYPPDEKYKTNLVSTFSNDLGKIIKGLRRIKRFEKTKSFIESARRELQVALTFFSDREEADSTKRVRDRLQALDNCKNSLDKALLQWPSP